MANIKVTELTVSNSTLSSDDLFYTVDDPAGTPTSGKTTFGELLTSIGIASSTTKGLASSTQASNITSAYSHSQLTSGNPHSVTATEIGLGNVENTALSSWTGSSTVTIIGETAVTSHEGALSITASQVSDFDTEVGNNVDVAANTSDRHAAVTIGTASGLSLSGQEVSLALATSSTNGAFSNTEKLKLAAIEASADVTDATNVADAGAIMDGDFSTNGLMSRTGAGTYSIVTDSSSNWDTGYSHSQVTTGNPHSVTKSDVGLGNVENSALSTWTGSSTVITVGETAVTAHEAALGITVSQISDFDTEVSGNSDVSANTSARHAAVTLAGEDFLSLTGQQITANAINLDNLSASGTASSTTYLRGDNTWATVSSGGLSNVVEDTTPQLGGDLDAQDKNITGVATVGFTQELDNGSKSASFSVDFGTDQKQKVTLTANTMTLTLDTTFDRVGNYVLKIVNGGLATLTWASETGAVYWPGGTAPTLTDSGTDVVTLYYDGTNWYGQAGLDFS